MPALNTQKVTKLPNIHARTPTRSQMDVEIFLDELSKDINRVGELLRMRPPSLIEYLNDNSEKIIEYFTLGGTAQGLHKVAQKAGIQCTYAHFAPAVRQFKLDHGLPVRASKRRLNRNAPYRGKPLKKPLPVKKATQKTQDANPFSGLSKKSVIELNCDGV